MKKIIQLVLATFISTTLLAQSPEKMSYQAVIRNSSAILVSNQSVQMRISILEGSASGSAVYVETHTPTTNANGLVSLAIGEGTVVSGNFSSIDWGSNSFYIKTETDPTGGTNYTITGTSQFMSVPYALHATTADALTGGIVEVDGSVTNELQTISRTGTVVTLTDGGSFTDSVNVYNAGQGIEIVNNVVSTETVAVGDFAYGGVVYWVDSTGTHGLICAISDQSNAMRWYAGTNGYTRAQGTGIGAGLKNTCIIIPSQVAIGDDGNMYAARLANEYSNTVASVQYGDWYLPSLVELNLLFQNRFIINATAVAHGGTAFTNGFYWSSNEVDAFGAYYQNFNDGIQDDDQKSSTHHVRAVKRF